MGKRKFASTRIKGAEPRVRFNRGRREDGSTVGEAASGDLLKDENGNDVPVIINRVVFQCVHTDTNDWQAVVGMTVSGHSVQIRCDLCRYAVRIPDVALAGLIVLGTDHQFCVEHKGAIGIGRQDERPAARYVVVNLKATESLLRIWRAKLAAES